MLRLLEEEITLPLPASPMSIQIEALMKTYGFTASFAFFWVQETDGKITAAVSKVDSHVTVAADKDFDPQELREFLGIIGYSSLFGEKRVLEDSGFKISEKGFIMKYKGAEAHKQVVDVSPLSFEPPYRKIYALLKSPENFGERIPPYGDWLCDISARVRKGCAEILYREKGKECISCGMFTFESGRGAVIGAVATNKDFRSKGYGSDIVKELCAKGANKEIFLMCNEDMTSFYKKLEFQITGEFALVSGE